MRSTLFLIFVLTQLVTAEPIHIGSHRELFVDDQLIQKLEGEVTLQLHHPRPREIAIVHDASWEGTGSGYHSIFKDGDIYRMYYKAWHIDTSQGELDTSRHPLYCCYAESNDGITWRKPSLGLHAFEGSKGRKLGSMLNSQVLQIHKKSKRGKVHISYQGNPLCASFFRIESPESESGSWLIRIRREGRNLHGG